MLKWALVPVFFAPGTRETFSSGWCLQPGLKVPVQRLLRLAQWQGTFSPGWRHQPGLKVDLYSRLEPPTGTKSPLSFSAFIAVLYELMTSTELLVPVLYLYLLAFTS